MKNATRTNYFEKIAKVFSMNYGLKVEVRGTQALYDMKRKVVVVPETVDSLDRDARKVYEGLLDHEALGHAFAEFDCAERGVELPSQIVLKILRERAHNLKFLFNAIEDARIERVACEKWIGVADNLDRCIKWAFNKQAKRFEEEGEQGFTAWWFVGCGVYAYARGYESLVQWFPADVLEFITVDLAEEIAMTKKAINPSDCEAIARRILDKVNSDEDVNDENEEGEEGQGEAEKQEGDADESEDGAEGQSEGSSSEGENGPVNDEQAEGQGEGSSDGEDASEGDTEGDTGDASEEADSNESGGDGSEGNGSNNVEKATSFTDKLRNSPAPESRGLHHDAMDELEAEAQEAHEADLAKITTSPQIKAEDRVERLQEPRGWYLDTIKSQTRSLVGGLSARVAALLKTKSNVRHSDQERGRLDSRALSSIKTGSRTVFQQERKASTIDTAVSVVVDCSGSMEGDKMHEARKAALVLGEALDRAGVPFEVVGFFSDHRSKRARDESFRIQTTGDTFTSRAYPIVEQEVKGFSDNWKKRSKFCASLYADGCNHDPAELEKAAARLMARPEARKIVLFLSDGQPADPGFEGYGTNTTTHGTKCLKAKIEEVKGLGVEVAGIGILSDHVLGIYDRAVVVNNPAELPKLTVKLLKDLLTTRRRRAA